MVALVLAALPALLPPDARALAGTWLATVPSPGSGYAAGFAGPGRPPRTLRLALVIQPQHAAPPRAFVIEPEMNYGVFVRLRTVHVEGSRVTLAAPRRPDIIGRYRAGRLAFELPDVGPASFRRATVAETRAVTATSRDSVAIGTAPARTRDGWRTARPRDVGIDAGAMRAIVAGLAGARPGLRVRRPHALLVARHGRLAVEAYFAGYGRDTLHDLRSAGKSIAPLLFALAARHDPTLTLQSRVVARARAEGPPHPDARTSRITANDLLTMRSGLACDDDDDASPGNEDRMQSQTARRDWYAYTLALPMAADPGTRAVYCSAGINLVGAMLPAAAHASVAQLFARELAAPLGITNYALPLQPAPRGAAYLGGGERLRPRDALKLGQLLLDDGRWNGRRVVDARWVRAMVVPQTRVRGEIGAYGDAWHVYRYVVAGRRVTAVSAGGNGGQLVFAIPAYDLAIAIDAGNYNQFPVWLGFITSTVPRVLDAVAGPHAHSRIVM